MNPANLEHFFLDSPDSVFRLKTDFLTLPAQHDRLRPKKTEGAVEETGEETVDEETEGSCTAVSGTGPGSAPYRPEHATSPRLTASVYVERLKRLGAAYEAICTMEEDVLSGPPLPQRGEGNKGAGPILTISIGS